jgi:hypothetical protein
MATLISGNETPAAIAFIAWRNTQDKNNRMDNSARQTYRGG